MSPGKLCQLFCDYFLALFFEYIYIDFDNILGHDDVNHVSVWSLLSNVHNILNCDHIHVTVVMYFTIDIGDQYVHLLKIYGWIPTCFPIGCIFLIILFNSVFK